MYIEKVYYGLENLSFDGYHNALIAAKEYWKSHHGTQKMFDKLNFLLYQNDKKHIHRAIRLTYVDRKTLIDIAKGNTHLSGYTDASIKKGESWE